MKKQIGQNGTYLNATKLIKKIEFAITNIQTQIIREIIIAILEREYQNANNAGTMCE